MNHWRKDKRKKWLYRYVLLKRKLDLLNKRLVLLDQKIDSIQYSNDSALSQGRDRVILEDLLTDKADLENRIARMREQSLPIKNEISDRINTLNDPRDVELLKDRFIYDIPMSEIADSRNRTERTMFYHFKRIIEKLPFSDLYKDNKKK